MPDQELLIVRGARVHNLKNIDLEMPRNRLVVITGLSGSGKSSLAFDTIYAEGQRRYVESLSAYARQFLGLMERPDVDYIDGLSPAISIEQKTVSHNPRSTVGTVTEIYDYLRLLFARVGVQHCTNCGKPVQRQTSDQIIDTVMEWPAGTKVQVLAPVIKGRKGHYRELFEKILKDGFLRVRVDGQIREIAQGMQVNRYEVHDIEVVVDRLIIGDDMRSRVADSVETALVNGSGAVIFNVIAGGEKGRPSKKKRLAPGDRLFSQRLACLTCGISYDDPAPNSFSFNSPYGSCRACAGLGEIKEFDLDLILPDPELSIEDEGIAPLGKPRDTWLWSQVRAVMKKYGIAAGTPVGRISEEARNVLLNGSGSEKLEIPYTTAAGRSVTYRHRYTGILATLKKYYDETSSNGIRQWAESYMNTKPCAECGGGRLRRESLAVKLHDEKSGETYGIQHVVRLPIDEAEKFFSSIALSGRATVIAAPILKEVRERLRFLLNVGLEYLTLDRPARTLAGGEGQRIRLATQIGTQLVGVMYVLDEPSIGLHQRDNIKLINSLKSLRDLGNTVLVVEHDREMIESADYVVDLGPGAGEHGGEVVVTGEPRVLAKGGKNVRHSQTVQYLTNARRIELPPGRRPGNGLSLRLRGAAGNNLRSVNLELPLGRLICVTGVSGSGKSTLISETLYRILARKFYRSKDVPLPYATVAGLEHIDKVIEIDQSPIGRTPRSNPATYTGVFTFIRDLFAMLPESKIRGYSVGRFSFNVKGGRCEACEGDGLRKIEMNFLPDVYVLCEVCKGKRYNRETLDVRFKSKSVSDVLDMTIEEAVSFFSEIPKIERKLKTLNDVGLGYLRLGQQATTLSGGEAQRVKLSTELSKVGTGKTMYILDEPTTGLHFEDIRMLLGVLNALVDRGNTVVVIEHNLDVIKTADWVIDLGPGGGVNGGRIVAEGTPEHIAANRESETGKFLKAELARGRNGQ